MRNTKGQFIKGHRSSPSTEFKKGGHWRKSKAHWNYYWLYNEYAIKGLSAADIAIAQGCTDNNILYWLHKHGIPRRSISEARLLKHWGLSGGLNGMYGVTGADNPNWKGGITPERQAIYVSGKWKSAVKSVWKRDKATCQRCGKKANSRGGDQFHIHHIVSFEVVGLRTDPDNLVLACIDCHHWIHSRENKQRDWIS